jgi:leader peptidase (prepilin peptidase)/N-methyltransferase
VLPDAVWAVLAGLLGLAIGSFLNVVIHRVPADESVVRPSSHCPACGAAIRERHNVPVVGWLVLRGKCYDCKAPISPRYPLIELATGVLFALVTLRVLDVDLATALPVYLYFAAMGVALTMIDIDHHRLPDKIVLPSQAAIAVLLVIASAGSGDWWALERAGIGAASAFALYYVLWFIYPKGIGYGDVKLAGILGAVSGYLSWGALAVGGVSGFCLGAVFGIGVMISGRSGKTEIPHGPFMIAAGFVALFLANPIVHGYLHLAGLR